MARVAGFQSVLGTGKLADTDMSAAVPTIAKFARIDRFEWTTDPSIEDDPSATYHGPEFAHLGRVDTRFNVEGVLISEGALEHLLLSVFGDVTTTGGADPYTHTYAINNTIAASKAYIGVETHLGSSNKALQANMAIERLEWRWGQNSYTRFMARGLGSKPVIASKTAASFPANGLPFPGKHRGTLTLDGVTTLFVEDAVAFVEHRRHPEGHDGISRFRKSAEYLSVQAGLECTVLYDDALGLDVLEKAFDADNATSPSDTAAQPSYFAADYKVLANPSGNEDSLKWSAPKVVIAPQGNAVPALQGRELMRQRIQLRAFHNGTKQVEAVLLNSQSTV